MLAEAAVLALLLYALWWNFVGKRRLYPPGPTPLPFLEKTFSEWARSHGPVFTVWLGPMPFVAITDLQLLKKYGGDDFAGRADNFAVRFMTGGNNGVLNAMGPIWKEQRRFALHVLRDLGFGKGEMEPRIHAQILRLCRHLDQAIAESEQGVIRVDYPMELAVGNVLSSVLFGKHYPPDDAQFAEMRSLNCELMNLVTGPAFFLLICYPWLRFLPIPGRFGFSKMVDVKRRFWTFFRNMLQECKSRWDPLAPATDFTSAYFQEIRRRQKAGEDMGFFNDEQLTSVMADFALAGMDTTRATLEWAVLYMLHYPDVQENVQKELDIFYSNLNRPVSMTDRQQLPYTTATLMEIQRLTNVLPINLQHSTVREVEVEGFRLPAGTPILSQISSVLADPAHFPQPAVFNPLRFLDENANRIKKVEELVPFGVGKRQCGGESLARMNLFLVFASLLYHYSLAPAPGKPLPSLVPQQKYTRSPVPFLCRVSRRRPLLYADLS